MKKRYFFIILILLVILVYASNITQLPSRIFLLNGENIQLKRVFGVEFKRKNKEVQETWQDKNLETTKMAVMLFGNIKVKEIAVTKYPRINVVPTGNLIGLKLYTNGALVIGTTEVKNIENKIEKPYESINIKEGDTILEVDHQEIDSTQTLQKIVNESNGRDIEIKYASGGETYTANIKPANTAKGEYKLGLWIRDSASGVGTMAFYEPESKKFAALGHGISDGDTGELLDIQTGELVNSKIVSVSKGRKGIPGEIKGSIAKQATIGTVMQNTNFGIFGSLNENIITNNKYSAGLEIALRDEIKLGEATILSTVKNNETQEYEVEITSIDSENNSNNKSMQIKITDENLLSNTGGIICGMSGSPIIQNNKIVGALTNVLVSDPQIGYGIFADIMIKEMMK